MRLERESHIGVARETKLFDPRDGFGPLTDPLAVTDATVFRRQDRWWMCAGGKVKGREGIHLFSATLEPGAPLAAAGWKLTADPRDASRVEILAGYESSAAWDHQGGRHCPCHVKGWDPRRGAWVERIYYAGASQFLWGPYAIGYLEWDGERWIDQAAPVFLAAEDWERGSVYEPNVIYADGRWKMWYVAGSNQQNYIVQGYAESQDGATDWSKHTVFMPAEEKIFDFHVFRGVEGYEAVFSRIALTAETPAENAGLWWCESEDASADAAHWSQPVQILTAADRGWHSGPWKPSAQYGEGESKHLFVFFDGVYRTADPGPFPFAFTLV